MMLRGYEPDSALTITRRPDRGELRVYVSRDYTGDGRSPIPLPVSEMDSDRLAEVTDLLETAEVTLPRRGPYGYIHDGAVTAIVTFSSHWLPDKAMTQVGFSALLADGTALPSMLRTDETPGSLARFCGRLWELHDRGLLVPLYERLQNSGTAQFTVGAELSAVTLSDPDRDGPALPNRWIAWNLNDDQPVALAEAEQRSGEHRASGHVQDLNDWWQWPHR